MIQITGLTKVYRRARPPAVLDLTFDARPGMVTALLGDEGAGKSTALRLMVELERGHGITLFDGRTYRRIRRPEREVGLLLPSGRPEAGHPGLRARAHLRMLAGTAGVPAKRADELLEQTRLAAVADHRIGTFSPGMHRRLALAAALLGTPSALLLDAPTEGLSPRNEEWFHAFLRSFAVAGGTVLLTTRFPQEAATLADRVVTLDQGRLAADQPVVEFRRTRLHPEVAVRGPQMSRLADLLTGQGAQVRRDGGAGLAVSGIGRTEIGELAYRNGILLHELADKVVERPVSYPATLPAGSGRSGQVRIRTTRQEPDDAARSTAPDLRPVTAQPRPAGVARPTTPDPDHYGEPDRNDRSHNDEHRPKTSEPPHRPLDHRGLQAGRWAAAALAPTATAPTANAPAVPTPAPAAPTALDAEHLATTPTDAELLAATPGVPAPQASVPQPANVPAPPAPAAAERGAGDHGASRLRALGAGHPNESE
ncbi:ABC transporter ATP-binding protein [Kitasatospora sp. NPDC049285]|uniref:ABC transporter ATP-binding protein n=1 Tax=Kitasatospora sp. NPDC049285 TaxID=3157096 RepID=UPI0034399CB5